MSNLGTESETVLAERRRVTIGQMADFDFAGLCRKVSVRFQPGTPITEEPCEVCDTTAAGRHFCLVCVGVVLKVIADRVEAAKLRDGNYFAARFQLR